MSWQEFLKALWSSPLSCVFSPQKPSSTHLALVVTHKQMAVDPDSPLDPSYIPRCQPYLLDRLKTRFVISSFSDPHSVSGILTHLVVQAEN